MVSLGLTPFALYYPRQGIQSCELCVSCPTKRSLLAVECRIVLKPPGKVDGFDSRPGARAAYGKNWNIT